MSNSLKMLKRRPRNQLTVARYLLSSYYIYNETLDFEEQLCLNEVMLALLDIRDPLFKHKYGTAVRYSAVLLAIFNNNKISRTEKVVAISKTQVNLHGVWLRERQYKAAEVSYSSVIRSFVLRARSYKRRRFPPKRYIGVGYRDKGSRKNLAYDGSPSWQEVASADYLGGIQENSSRKVLTFLTNNNTIYNESKRWIRQIRDKIFNTYPTYTP